MGQVRAAHRDLLGAVLLVGIGAGVAYAGRQYGVGSLLHMGAGYLPLMLGGLLAASGVLIALTSAAAAPIAHRISLRAVLGVLGGVGAFMLFGVWGGMVPATFASVFLAALGDRRNSVRDAALLALGMAVLGELIFGVALHLQFDAFRWG